MEKEKGNSQKSIKQSAAPTLDATNIGKPSDNKSAVLAAGEAYSS
jgi:hypothetical protein